MLAFVLLLFLLPSCSKEDSPEYITKEELPELLQEYDGHLSAWELSVKSIVLVDPINGHVGGKLFVSSDGQTAVTFGNSETGGHVLVMADEKRATLEAGHVSNSMIRMVALDDASMMLIRPDFSDKDMKNIFIVTTSNTDAKGKGGISVVISDKGKITELYP